MYFDIPELQRCCGCVPARYGLLVWMYIRLIMSMLTLVPFTFVMAKIFMFHISTYELIVAILILVSLVVDVIMNIVALVGGHSKNPKLLKVYYYYSFVAILMFIAIILFFISEIIAIISFMNGDDVLRYLEWYTVVGITGVGIQVYMLLLLRSKLRKLNDHGQFQFINQAAEAECTMLIEEPVCIAPERTINELGNKCGSDENELIDNVCS